VKLKITVDGKTYEVEVEASEPETARPPPSAGPQTRVGDVLLVLEAMKMETNITAPVAAQVARIAAAVGEPVKTGQVLVEFA
jgi:methylmalonyl-CoA carboxyltransferase small subunit